MREKIKNEIKSLQEKIKFEKLDIDNLNKQLKDNFERYNFNPTPQNIMWLNKKTVELQKCFEKIEKIKEQIQILEYLLRE